MLWMSRELGRRLGAAQQRISTPTLLVRHEGPTDLGAFKRWTDTGIPILGTGDHGTHLSFHLSKGITNRFLVVAKTGILDWSLAGSSHIGLIYDEPDGRNTAILEFRKEKHRAAMAAFLRANVGATAIPEPRSTAPTPAESGILCPPCRLDRGRRVTMVPSTDPDLPPGVAADTFRCPECGHSLLYIDE